MQSTCDHALRALVPLGVAFHHAGLLQDERAGPLTRTGCLLVPYAPVRGLRAHQRAAHRPPVIHARVSCRDRAGFLR